MIARIKGFLSLRKDNEELRRRIDFLEGEVEYHSRRASERFFHEADYFHGRHQHILAQNEALLKAAVDIATFRPITQKDIWK